MAAVEPVKFCAGFAQTVWSNQSGSQLPLVKRGNVTVRL